MIDFIIGEVVNIMDDYIVIQNNNIGFKVFTSITSMMELEIGKKNQMLYTKLNVREDAIELYGFVTEEEMEMFNLITRVTKIGPKTGLNVLSTITPSQIKMAIHTRDFDTLCKAPGIGKKTAERIVLELKDKIGEIDEVDIETGAAPTSDHDEVVDALMSLGYSKYEVEKVLRSIVDIESLDVEDIIREGLKRLSMS